MVITKSLLLWHLRPISYENGKVLLTLTMGDPFAMTMGVFLTDNNDDDDDDDNNHNGTEFQHVWNELLSEAHLQIYRNMTIDKVLLQWQISDPFPMTALMTTRDWVCIRTALIGWHKWWEGHTLCWLVGKMLVARVRRHVWLYPVLILVSDCTPHSSPACKGVRRTGKLPWQPECHLSAFSAWFPHYQNILDQIVHCCFCTIYITYTVFILPILIKVVSS